MSMTFSIRKSLQLLRRTYRQLAFLWFVYIVLVGICTMFVTSVARSFLEKSSESVLSSLQSKVSSDLLEAETALRGASLNIQRMIQHGDTQDDVQAYIREFTDYVLRENRRVTGVMGVYGVFNVYNGAYIDASGRMAAGLHAQADRQWHTAAIGAKGAIATTPPHYDENTGEWKVTFSRCVYYGKGGKIAAVIGLDMHLGVLKRYFAETHLAEGGYGIMMDEDLNIIASSVKETIGQPMSALKTPDIFRIMAELNKGVNLSGYKTVNNREGGEKIIIYSRRLENGWHIGIITPIKKYFKEIYDRGMYIFILGTVLQLTLSLIVLRIASARQQADEKNVQKSNFLASMSHEIRTPMNAIIGFAELALREDIPPAAYEHIFTIKQAGANLLSIINDILDFSKIESGKLEIVNGDYMFASLVHDVISIIKMRATYSRIRFVVNVDSSIPNALHGDEIRVRQIMLNVLSNAVKYTDKGHVALAVTGEMSGAADDTIILKIEVADSGRGIKKEDLENLFKDFVQVDKAKNKGIEGTGLGLAITNNILKVMGGAISVESEYGLGSIFTITLPQKFTSPARHAVVENRAGVNALVYERRELFANSIVRTMKSLGVNCTLVSSEMEFEEQADLKPYHFVFTAPALCDRAKKILRKHGSNARMVLLAEFGDAIADQDVTILSMPAYSVTVANVLNGAPDNLDYGAKKQGFARFIAPDAKVLIVDDTNTNLRVAEGLLAPYKMQITLCKSGVEAIEAVKSEQYDAVFMDHMMPGMDGLEATKRIRNLGSEYRKLPIIALTANAVAGAREMFLSEGCNDFVSKPIEIAKLNAVLDKWIPKEKRRNPAEESGRFELAKEGENKEFESVSIIGIDMERGIALSGGTAYYLRTLAMFYEDGFEKIQEIKRCLDTGDLQLFTTHIHGLKSASASIGANTLSDTAMALETAGKEMNQTYISATSPKFLMDFEALLRDIGRTLSELKPEKKSAANSKTLTPELVKLRDALDTFDSEAIDQATGAMQEYEDAEDVGCAVKAILQDVLIGEYENALELINKLLGELEAPI